MKKKGKAWGLLLSLLVLLAALLPAHDRILPMMAAIGQRDVLVIDAGHGGYDGGAQSAQGTSEKDINLAIAKKLQQLAQDQGWLAVMTRETDVELGGGYKGTIRSRKTRDLKGRAELIQNWHPKLAVSIHLNSFTQDTSVHGAQVFYPATAREQGQTKESERLAKSIRKAMQQTLKGAADRPALAKRDSYLFKWVSCPIALVECGFLSNPTDAQKLQSDNYQQELARSIFSGIMGFSGKTPQKRIEFIENLRKNQKERKTRKKCG